jgi:hypothetical protein
LDFVKNHKGLGIGGGIIVLLLIMVVSFISSINTTRNTLVTKEQELVGEYKTNQNELSTYTNQVKESIGVADIGNDKVGQILKDAISGRYDNDMQPGTGGSMFSAISEAYPDLTANTAMYAKVQDQVIAGRNQYRNTQNKLIDRARDYETWIQTDFVRSFIVKNILGAPTENLKITIGESTLRGQEALDKLSQPIMSSDAIKAYDTGVSDPVITSTPKESPAKK